MEEIEVYLRRNFIKKVFDLFNLKEFNREVYLEILEYISNAKKRSIKLFRTSF